MSVDHRVLLQAMDLAHVEEHSPGVVFWHPPGVSMLRRLENFCRHLHESEGYQEVRSPLLLSRSLWERSGHWQKYREAMYVVNEGDLALKPMSCPGHLAIFADARRSYRDLPFRLFEFGAVHRQEPSGALSGLFRLRGFVQDDSHVVLARKQIQEGVEAFVRMVEQAYPAMGFERWSYRIALRPEVRSGDDNEWDAAEAALRQAAQRLGLVCEEAPGEGAFYGPKLEVALHDGQGRSWQCGVVQVDFVLPRQFDLSFQNAGGESERPVVLHHAVFGSLERFVAILMEHHGGLPDGLAPCPVAVCPIGEAQQASARALVAQLRAQGVPARGVEDGPLNGRLRHLAQAQVPVWAILGAREDAQGHVMVRRKDDPKGRLWERSAWVQKIALAWHQVAPCGRLPAV